MVLLALRPTPPELSAALPLKLAGTEAAWNELPPTGVATVAVIGAVLSSAKLMALPVNVLPTLSVAVVCTVKVPSACADQVGKVALLVHAADVPPLTALCVV